MFDFGLATFMSEDGDPYEDEYEMSGAGSPRYMAPEVLVNPPKPYNMKVDVYSFGIVLWEILSLQRPYAHVRSQDELVDYVAIQGGRPAINDEWKEPVKETLTMSFSADSTARPTIKYCYDFLRKQLIERRDGDASQLSDSYIKRRRSQASMQLELSLHVHNYQQQMKKEKTLGHKVSAAMKMNTLRNKLRLSTKKEEE
jgi:serine/threonine protein kinase